MTSDDQAAATGTPVTAPKEPDDVRMEDVRRVELDTVFGRPSIAPDEAKDDPDDETAWGVALSGGGIRSATFGLGVLQALARRGLLPGFHYQSTVSGGGYIGSFVQALIHRYGIGRAVEVLSSSVTDAPKDAQDGGAARRDGFDPQQPIRHLRQYSNYLSPRKTALSGDTMSIVGNYVRNVLLVQVQLVALLVAACLTPLILYVLVGWFDARAEEAVGTAAVLCIVAACLVAVISSRSQLARNGNGAGRGVKVCALAVIVTLGLATLVGAVGLRGVGVSPRSLAVSTGLLYFGVWLLWFLYDVLVAPWRRMRTNERVAPSPIRKHPVRFLAASAGSAAIAGLALLGAHHLLAGIGGLAGAAVPYAGKWYVILLGPTVVLMAIMLAGIAHVGFAGPALSDLQREIWARIGGRAARLVILGTAAMALTVYGPWLLFQLGSVSWAGLAGWLATTGVGVLGAFGKRSNGTGGLRPLEILVRLAPPIFVVGLLIATSLCAHLLLQHVGFAGVVAWSPPNIDGSEAYLDYLGKNSTELRGAMVALFLMATAVAVLFGMTIDVNEFSMNAFYRNRLVRCYLGASRKRAAEPTTDFDPDDDIALAVVARDAKEVADAENARAAGKAEPPLAPRKPRPLYPLVGTALNLAATRQLDWQDRKAASFCLTPDYCGYVPPSSRPGARSIGDVPPKQREAAMRNREKARLALWATRDAAQKKIGEPSEEDRRKEAALRADELRKEAAQRDDEDGNRLARALTLGSATAISGAAVSPNMGYHSSPAVTFLLTVFDARLGWWVANPHHEQWPPRADRTPSSLYRMVCELLGLTRDDDKFVYLSDGGHFENLGLYELVRRRCRFIVCVDAGADRARSFADLGNAVQKCRVDFGANIDIDVSALRPAPDGLSGRACAVGTVAYTNGTIGTILYLKPSLTGAEPPDVAHYASAHRSFPHESTADQFFDEKQFESYRRLGEHVADTAIAPALERTRRVSRSAPFEVDASTVKEKFLVELYHQWVTPLAGVRDNFATHGKAMASLFEKMRTTKELAVLDAQIYPAWTDLVKGDGKPGNLPVERRTTLPAGDDFRACFYFCQELMQLMESVYHDLSLEQFWRHPDNRGWMNIFRYWSWSPMFRIAWGASAPTYGSRFATFCETRLDLPALDDLVEIDVQSAGDDWSTLCKRLVDEGAINHVEHSILTSEMLAEEIRFGAELVLLRLRWHRLLAGTKATPPDTTFGIALVRSANRDRPLAPLVRVQDHLRGLGFGAAFVRELVGKYPGLQIDVREGDYKLGGVLTCDAARALRKQLDQLLKLAEQHECARERQRP